MIYTNCKLHVDKVVAKFLGDCESAVDVEDLATLFVKEHGTSSQVCSE